MSTVCGSPCYRNGSRARARPASFVQRGQHVTPCHGMVYPFRVVDTYYIHHTHTRRLDKRSDRILPVVVVVEEVQSRIYLRVDLPVYMRVDVGLEDVVVKKKILLGSARRVKADNDRQVGPILNKKAHHSKSNPSPSHPRAN